MSTKRLFFSAVLTACLLLAVAALATPPTYIVYNIGRIDPGDYGSQGIDVSTMLGYATGSNLGNNNQGWVWTMDAGLVPLPNLAGRSYAKGNGVNFHGVVVGTGSTTFYGSSPLPLIWTDGVVAQLPLPSGETLGRAEAINNAGVVVGSVDGGTLQQAAIYAEGTSWAVTQTTDTGCWGVTFYDVNDAGMAVGTGWDPADASRNVGFVLDMTTDTAFEVEVPAGDNGAICFGVSEAGHVVGSAMAGQGNGMPFVWTQADGAQEIPLPTGASTGSGRGVNSDGWVVGNAGGTYAVPWLWDRDATYRIADLLPAGSIWDMATNTSSSAEAISDEGIIVGTGVYEGSPTAYALVPEDVVPALLDEFTATGSSAGITVTWKVVLIGQAANFTLQRATSMNGPWLAVSTPSSQSGTATSVLDADTEVGLTYHYRLVTPAADGSDLVVAYASAQRTVIGGLALAPAAPNPTSGDTRLAYRLPTSRNVRITVHDVRGRLVRSLVDDTAGAGEHAVIWNGCDDQGRRAPAGVYFVNLQTGQGQVSRRVVLTR